MSLFRGAGQPALDSRAVARYVHVLFQMLSQQVLRIGEPLLGGLLQPVGRPEGILPGTATKATEEDLTDYEVGPVEVRGE